MEAQDPVVSSCLQYSPCIFPGAYDTGMDDHLVRGGMHCSQLSEFSISPLAPPPMREEDHVPLFSAHGEDQYCKNDEGTTVFHVLPDCSPVLPTRNEDYSHMFPAPGDDERYYHEQFPHLTDDGAINVDLDDTLLLPFSEIDLDALMSESGAPVAVAPPDEEGLRDRHACDHGAQATTGHENMITEYCPSNIGCQVVRYEESEERPVAEAVAPPRGRRANGPAGGKTRLDHIGFEELRKYFYMPITKAAREMNVGLTVLKKRCRELGIARWPHRKMKSLKSLIVNVQEMGRGMSPQAMHRELAALETYCTLMEANPELQLSERTKKLRQACFKENYKRRRAAVVADMLPVQPQLQLQYCSTAGARNSFFSS